LYVKDTTQSSLAEIENDFKVFEALSFLIHNEDTGVSQKAISTFTSILTLKVKTLSNED
jgi:hypothetical protein